MGRIARTVMMVGGTAILVAMPREDYVHLAAQTREAVAHAYQLIDKHVVRPVRVASTSPADKEILSVPAPQPVLRPSLVSAEARRELATARIPELATSRAQDEARAAPAMTVAASVGSTIADAEQHDARALQPAAMEGAVGPESVRVAEQPVSGAGAASIPVAEPGPVGAAAIEVARQVETSPVVAMTSSDADRSAAAETQQAALTTVSHSVSDVAAAAEPQPTTKSISAITDDDSGDAAAVVPPPPSAKPEIPDEKKPPVAAKLLFGAAKTGAPLAARAIGFYSRGCLAGGKALPVDGRAWQAMRVSRNRNWGHPRLIALLERFATEVQKEDGWPGLLVGDISQPRGGPMLTGHASHQIGLDADIWFTPMPGRRLSRRERESMAATSMIDGPTKVDPTAFTPSHVRVVKRAAEYRDVERILVHPAIKKALCEAAGKDRGWLGKVRPYFGHYYHFHVRIGCPDASKECRAQPPPTGDDGCGKELDDWFKRLTRKPRPEPKVVRPVRPKPPITLADLPQHCKLVLEAGDGPLVKDEAELVKSSIERSKDEVDISGKTREEALARKAR